MTTATLIPSYCIKIRTWFVHDALPRNRARGIAFHVENDDYFVTMAAVMGLLEDSLKSAIRNGVPPQSLYANIVHDLKNDWMHLQKHYRIEKK